MNSGKMAVEQVNGLVGWLSGGDEMDESVLMGSGGWLETVGGYVGPFNHISIVGGNDS